VRNNLEQMVASCQGNFAEQRRMNEGRGEGGVASDEKEKDEAGTPFADSTRREQAEDTSGSFAQAVGSGQCHVCWGLAEWRKRRQAAALQKRGTRRGGSQLGGSDAKASAARY